MLPDSRLILIILLLSSYGHASEEAARWQEDLDVYADKLVEQHIDPFHAISEANFGSEIARFRRAIPQKTPNQILVEFMRLTHRFDDGHTSFPLWGWELDSFPFGLKLIGDDLYVVKTTGEHKDLLGSRLISIDGVASSEVVHLFSELTPFSENEFSTAARVADYLPVAQLLNGLGIVQDTGKTAFTFDVEGDIQRRLLGASRAPTLDFQISHLNDTVFSPEEKVNDDLWFGSSAENKTLYFKFRRYTSVSEMESLAEKALSFINRSNSKNLIIDLRDNYGGDFFAGLKLAQLLILADSIDWKSGVYVLIDNVTFSAAMNNAAQFSQILNAKLVGAPTGARPSGYQEMGQFTLPNSKLAVTYSKRLYHFKEGQKDALYPDVNIEVSIEDYKSENDPQLRWVLNDIDERGNAGD